MNWYLAFSQTQNAVIEAELAFQQGFGKLKLPKGAIHADLFVDNVLFDGERVALSELIAGGEDSFAVRLESLKNARKSIRIQALVFKGDEAGLRIAGILNRLIIAPLVGPHGRLEGAG